LNILVVEDDVRMTELLARGLREEAYQVDIARRGVNGPVVPDDGRVQAEEA